MKKVEVAREAFEKVIEGGPVIYSKWVKGKAEIGEMVEVYSEGELVGCGIYDQTGPVRVRIMDFDKCPLRVEDLWEQRILEALEARYKNGSALWDAFRLLAGDGDLTSGLIVDIYKDTAVLQSSSLAVDKHLRIISELLVKNVGIRNVVNKSVQRVRLKVGLEPREEVIVGKAEEVIVDEEGVKFKVNFKLQKTGLYLDQRENRVYFRNMIKDGSFLDAFSYTGGFGLHALFAGAKEVTFVDEDEEALSILRENLKINGFEGKVEIVKSDIWPFLRGLRRRYDYASFDPPAFIPSKEYMEIGMRDYMRLYTYAFKTVESGGILSLSSCSYFFNRELFLRTIAKASMFAKRNYKIFALRGASRDHVLRGGADYLEYLKNAFIYVT